MNTRFRHPLQAAALLFSLSLFIGYLWSTQRQSGQPNIVTIPATESSPGDSISDKPLGILSTITLDPETITDFESFIHYGDEIKPSNISPMAPMFMPGSKSISQPVFSSRKKQTPARTQAQAPALVIPGSKSGRLELIPPPKADIPSMSATPPEKRAP